MVEKKLSDESAFEVTYRAWTARGVDLRHTTVIAASYSHAWELVDRKLKLEVKAWIIERFEVTRLHRLDLNDQIRRLPKPDVGGE